MGKILGPRGNAMPQGVGMGITTEFSRAWQYMTPIPGQPKPVLMTSAGLTVHHEFMLAAIRSMAIPTTPISVGQAGVIAQNARLIAEACLPAPEKPKPENGKG